MTVDLSPAAGPAVVTRPRAPGPAANQFPAYRRDQPRMTLRLQREYGDIVRYRIGPMLVHQVTHPDLIRAVLLDAPHDYRRGRFYEGFRAYFGDGLLTTDGSQWRRHRAVSRPAFHPGRIQDLSPAFTDAADCLVERLRTKMAADGGVDLVAEAMWYTIEGLGRCLFSTGLGHSSPRIAPAVQTGLGLIIQRMNPIYQVIPTWVPTRHNLALRRTLNTIEGVLDEVISDHRRHPREDLVQRHLEAAEGAGERLLTREEVRDGLMTTFLAGHETTGTSLAWTLYLLATHPEVRRSLEAEVDAVLGGAPATTAHLEQLPYCRMVVAESLRMYPPIWLFPRDAATDTELGGYHVPEGSTIFISPYATHRHPDLWENPEAFDPQRFLPERVAERDRHSYLPFGFGQRQCIGKHIAMQQLQIAVATVTQRMRLHVVPGNPPVTYRARVSLRPQQTPHPTLIVTAHERTGAPR